MVYITLHLVFHLAATTQLHALLWPFHCVSVQQAATAHTCREAVKLLSLQSRQSMYINILLFWISIITKLGLAFLDILIISYNPWAYITSTTQWQSKLLPTLLDTPWNDPPVSLWSHFALSQKHVPETETGNLVKQLIFKGSIVVLFKLLESLYYYSPCSINNLSLKWHCWSGPCNLVIKHFGTSSKYLPQTTDQTAFLFGIYIWVPQHLPLFMCSNFAIFLLLPLSSHIYLCLKSRKQH